MKYKNIATTFNITILVLLSKEDRIENLQDIKEKIDIKWCVFILMILFITIYYYLYCNYIMVINQNLY